MLKTLLAVAAVLAVAATSTVSAKTVRGTVYEASLNQKGIGADQAAKRTAKPARCAKDPDKFIVHYDCKVDTYWKRFGGE